MHCEHCLAELPDSARFCPACGVEAPARVDEAAPRDASITAPGVHPGVWHRMLLVLMAMERLAAWYGFPLHDPPWRIPEPWEITFLEAWGLGLFLVAAPFLILRRRAGGWLAAASAGALAIRACVPMLADQPAPGAVVALIVASATLTFAFLHEQSFWPHA